MNTNERRPRDYALLLLASGDEPPRQRARDQQADLAGLGLRRALLERLLVLDPDPDPIALSRCLDQIITECEGASGPLRALATAFAGDWNQAMRTPGLWDYLLTQALESSES